MTQEKHTPGPWITSVVFHDDGPATHAVHKKETAPYLIADCIHDEKTATLIAAAPELAKALRQIYELADRYSADKAGREAIAYAGEILAKAGA
jgi:hypothetical protein